MVWSREKYFIYGRYGILPEVLQPGVEGGGEAPATDEEDEEKKVKISSISQGLDVLMFRPDPTKL